jgi:antitoxin ParD1/3/4
MRQWENRGTGPHLCVATTEAAPCVAVFDEWVPRTSIPGCCVLPVLSIIDNPCHGCYSSFMPINVNLTPELEGLIRQKVSSGRYNSASEVVREALRLMEAEDQLRAAKLQQLRQDIQEGLHSGPARPWSVSAMKREGRKRLKASAASSRK